MTDWRYNNWQYNGYGALEWVPPWDHRMREALSIFSDEVLRIELSRRELEHSQEWLQLRDALRRPISPSSPTTSNAHDAGSGIDAPIGR